MSETNTSGPWWREPWPWIIMAGPLLALIGCAWTIVLAFQNFGDQAISDGGVKRGLVVERPLAEASSARPDGSRP